MRTQGLLVVGSALAAFALVALGVPGGQLQAVPSAQILPVDGLPDPNGMGHDQPHHEQPHEHEHRGSEGGLIPDLTQEQEGLAFSVDVPVDWLEELVPPYEAMYYSPEEEAGIIIVRFEGVSPDTPVDALLALAMSEMQREAVAFTEIPPEVDAAGGQLNGWPAAYSYFEATLPDEDGPIDVIGRLHVVAGNEDVYMLVGLVELQVAEAWWGVVMDSMDTFQPVASSAPVGPQPDGMDAYPIAIGELIEGSVAEGESVVYQVELEEGVTYIFDVQLGTLPDSVLFLLDGTGQDLAYNDDYSGTLASRITWTALETGTHYVEVEGYGMASGSYTLSVTGVRLP